MFVEALVDSAVLIIETIWPKFQHEKHSRMPLRKFIQETLKRSRTSYSTFQVSLYYLILVKQHDNQSNLKCGRRTFLSSLILAGKYIQDRNYNMTAWSKITGLSVTELKHNEIEFLKCVDWKLYIPHDVYTKWSDILITSATEDDYDNNIIGPIRTVTAGSIPARPMTVPLTVTPERILLKSAMKS